MHEEGIDSLLYVLYWTKSQVFYVLCYNHYQVITDCDTDYELKSRMFSAIYIYIYYTQMDGIFQFSHGMLHPCNTLYIKFHINFTFNYKGNSHPFSLIFFMSEYIIQWVT